MAKKRVDFDSAGGLLALWGGWGLGILAWLLHLMVSYGVVGWYCREERGPDPRFISLVLNGLTMGCGLLAVAGIVLAGRNLRDARRTEAGRRSRFMAHSGFLMSLLFLAIILMQGVPNLFLEPCQ